MPTKAELQQKNNELTYLETRARLRIEELEEQVAELNHELAQRPVHHPWLDLLHELFGRRS